ncbi:MAG TPA: OsmC family protein [Candidatus Saccharimonadaceae bacterium]|jgi:hypothetical protein|nr:OsmC family protein [Candidatus Saccharimonadaceae bacterium]
MTRPSPTPTACDIRAQSTGGGRVRLLGRHGTFQAEGQTPFQAPGSAPSALELLIGALAADLLAGFVREVGRAGETLDAVELTLSAELAHPLVVLGVVGEQGSAALSRIRGSLYVSGEGAEPRWRTLWAQALARAPVHATLARAVAIDLELKFVL